MPVDFSAFVYVIESPSDRDLLDGRTEGRVLLQSLTLAGIPAAYALVATSKGFRLALSERMTQAINANPGHPPILHLSMHGNSEGVGLTDGTFLSWSDLSAELKPLNDRMPAGVLICMSSCNGSSGQRMAMCAPHEKPFFALVGHAGSPEWSDAAVAYVAFYHRLFRVGGNLPDALEAMKAASGDDQFFVWWGPEVKRGWEEYLATTRKQWPPEVPLQAAGLGGLASLMDENTR